jgi:hypothetical protein
MGISCIDYVSFNRVNEAKNFYLIQSVPVAVLPPVVFCMK